MIKGTQKFDLLSLLPCRSLEDSVSSPQVERSSQGLYLRTPPFSDVQEWEENWRDLFYEIEDGKALERSLMTLEDVRSSLIRSSTSLVCITKAVCEFFSARGVGITE